MPGAEADPQRYNSQRSMKPNDYIGILKRAADSECGVSIRPADPRATNQIRRRLYYARDHARARGDNSFDSLATVIRYLNIDGRHAVELWVIPRNRIGGCETMGDGMRTEVSELHASELSPGLLARGFQPKPTS